MTLLIIHCPPKPFNDIDELDQAFNAQLDQFHWCLCKTDAATVVIQETGIGTIASMPYADEVIALLRTMDVRLMVAKVPLVNSKKLQQVLPSLIEDLILGGVNNALIYALPPIAGNPGSQRALAVIDPSWFYWLNNQLGNILTPRLRLIPDCFILPATIDSKSSTLIIEKSGNSHIYTLRTSEQLGISWIEDQDDAPLPTGLLGTNTLSWSWPWMASNAYEFSRRTDIASASLNLLLAAPSIRKLKIKERFKWLIKLNDANIRLSQYHVAWSDPLVWTQSFRTTMYTLCSVFIGWAVYSSWLGIDDWRWARNMDISAAQFLSAESITSLTQEQKNNSITSVFAKQMTLEARKHHLSTDADFVPMTTKLQKLKEALKIDSIEKMEYDGYRIDFEFKSGSEPIAPSLVIQKAQSLGLMVTELGNNRYRLQSYSGLGINSSNASL